jgi:hypothetical protein
MGAETDHRIPVKGDAHKDLHDLKSPGQMYDGFLMDLITLRKQQETAADVKATVERADDIEAMHGLMDEGEFEGAWSMMGLSREEAEAFAEQWNDVLGGKSEEQ